MKKFFLFISFIAVLNANDISKKVVFDLTSGDIKTFERKVLSGIVNIKSYYESNFQDLEVAVVIHGDAYKYFVNDPSISPFKSDKTLINEHKQLKTRLESLSDIYDVKFFMCDYKRKKLGIKKENLYKFVQLVPNSTIGLIDKGNEGFAYIPIH